MKHRGTFILALALLAVGAIGLIATPLLGPWLRSLDDFSSNGQRIYYTGADASGPIPRTVAGTGMMGFGMMSQVACVDCHGEDGRGGNVGMMFGAVDIPDVRYSVLTATRSEEGTTTPAWTDGDIARAIRDGIEPSGRRLKAPMPRWRMTDGDIGDVTAYLKELDAR